MNKKWQKQFQGWLKGVVENAKTYKGLPQQYLATAPKEVAITSINPTTERVIGDATIRTANVHDYATMRDEAVLAQKEWQKIPAPVRGDFVRELGNRFRDYKEYLGMLISVEMGKIYQEGLGEVQEMIDICDFAVGQSRMLYGKTMHSERPEHRMYEQWHPLGVVGCITAFNFPMAVWAWNAAISFICGNAVIWKPSTKTPLCAIAVDWIVRDLLVEMDLPMISHLFLAQSRVVAEVMLGDKQINLLSFTGSSKVGKHVSETVGKRMGKYLLECSGNNAVIVTEHANLDLAIPAIGFGAVGTAGQRCTSTRRVFVHRSKVETVKTRLVRMYGHVKIGDPTNEDTLMGPLIDKDAVSTFEKKIVEIQQAPDTEILIGGNTRKSDGNFVEPTIVYASQQTDLIKDEVFAPIVYIIPFNRLEEAIEMQNDVSQGLSSSIFTDNVQEAEQFLAAWGSDCGIANVNIGTSGAEIGGAFGGEKETGGGRESGSDAWKQYVRRQTNTINYGKDLPLAQGIKFKI